MIGEMDRRVLFYNPTVVKEASGGHQNAWVLWHECWCRYEQRSGFKSDAGSQDNLFTQATIEFRYHTLIGSHLNKDTVAIIRGLHYKVQDFKGDVRAPMVSAEVIAKKIGGTLINQNDLLVTSRIHTITAEQAADGNNSIIIPWLIGKTVITCISGRAVPFEIITSGTPDATEGLFVSATGAFSVPDYAPFVEGEEFEFLYR